MANEPQFLADMPARSWTPAAGGGFQGAGLYLGQGATAFEIAVARADAAPKRGAMLACWKARRDGRATPVLLVVLHPGGVGLCGAAGEDPPTYEKVDTGQVERLCRALLDQPDRHAALRFLRTALQSFETPVAGLNNAGLLALHELQHGGPKRPDWAAARRKAAAAVGKRDDALLTALGFQVEKLDNLTKLLCRGGQRTALAVLLQESETPEAGADRFNSLSPVSYALAKADEQRLPWVVLVQGGRLRLYASDVGAGVGRRGRTETYVECQPALLSDDHLAYLWLLYSAEALAADGSLNQLLESSARFAGALAEQLRERIYDDVVPVLARGIAAARTLNNPDTRELALTYEMALTVLFRLLFIAYAEDRDLLPYNANDVYRRRSLKQKVQELTESMTALTPIGDGDFHWREFIQLCRAVARGNPEWGVPAYDGGLFTDDPTVSRIGAELAGLSLPDTVFEAALRGLLVINTEEGVPGPVDFRALGVREFGTIYEGLLGSELALAESDLTRDQNDTYLPAGTGDPVFVEAGAIYLHNRSGARKASGSYYTKQFAVEHLLDGALEPALAAHFERLKALDDGAASAAFFDFRVADIAMGSGHFLIAAIDRIERGMADFLSRRDLPGVRRDLAELRDAARKALGPLAETATIEDGQLLRRKIAQHCVYGVDLNALSVQLARLAVWIHTFVPGLPLSVLDRSLVHGNALIGVGTIEDIRARFAAAGALFAADADSLLGQAAEPLRRLANRNDATLADIDATRDDEREVEAALSDTRALCDLITAGPLSEDEKVAGFPFEQWARRRNTPETHEAARIARRELADLHPLHFPIAFPQVFLRARPGFDAILGNPPWEKVKVEEHEFWARHFAGARGLSQRAYEKRKKGFYADRPDLVRALEEEKTRTQGVREALIAAKYPGMGTGDPDFCKGFCWRFWHLSAAQDGRIGVVLPREAFSLEGFAAFRLTLVAESRKVDIAMLLNTRGWAFDEVEQRYTIGLACIARGTPEEEKPIRLRGPYASREAFAEGMKGKPSVFAPQEVRNWTDSAALPLLPNADAIAVFAQLRQAPRLDLNAGAAWRARPVTNEMHTTQNKDMMDFNLDDPPDNFWPVYTGKSFNLWQPDTGEYYAWADPKKVLPWLFDKRLRSHKRSKNSAYREFSREYVRDRDTLAPLKARIAFRDVARATDTRTLIACLIPPRVFTVQNSPFLLWPRGEARDGAFLLGILSSIPMDWYARRFVEKHLSFNILNPFPVPREHPPHSSNDFNNLSDSKPRTRGDGSPDAARRDRVVALAGRLACPDARFADWAREVGVQYGPIPPDEKADMVDELDAVVAHLYGLSETQLIHVFETFHATWDYKNRLDAVLAHYRAWAARA